MKGLIKFFVFYSGQAHLSSALLLLFAAALGNMSSNDKKDVKVEQKPENTSESTVSQKLQPEEEKSIMQSQTTSQPLLTESKKEKKVLKIDPKGNCL